MQQTTAEKISSFNENMNWGFFLHLLKKILDGRFHFFRQFSLSFLTSLSLSVSLFLFFHWPVLPYGACCWNFKVDALLVTLFLEDIYQKFLEESCAGSGKVFNIKTPFQCVKNINWSVFKWWKLSVYSIDSARNVTKNVISEPALLSLPLSKKATKRNVEVQKNN